MDEPAKPFACNMPDCGMSFTNEDHLHVHTKKHDMVLQLGLEQKAAFVADQTPTPTRFIRNCEEVGLFQDLQNVAANPFDEGFKRAMESKPGLLTLESTVTPPDDALHTPHFPLLDTSEATLYTNNQRNVTISRSSSDESGTIKEYETRTISKLTNEVTTISRYVNDDVTIKQTETQSDIQTVSYKNNIITIESIESNVVRKDDATVPLIVYPEKKNVTIDNSKLQIIEKIPIMSQRSIDLVVDNLTSELETNLQQTVLETDKTKELNAMKNIDIQNARKKLIEVLEKEHVRLQKDTKKLPQILPNTEKLIKSEIVENFEVHIKLPNGKSVRMTPVKEENDKQEHVIKAKDIIRNKIAKKTINKNINVVKPVKIASGTLIPVTLVNTEGTPLSNADLSKVAITKINTVEEVVQLIPDGNIVKTLATPVVVGTNIEKTSQNSNVACDLKVKIPKDPTNLKAAQKPVQAVPDIASASETNEPDQPKRSRMDLDSRSAASRRYRERLKLVMQSQAEENKRLKEINQKLIAEKAVLKLVITEHMKKCPHAGEIADRLNDLMNGADIL